MEQIQPVVKVFTSADSEYEGASLEQTASASCQLVSCGTGKNDTYTRAG